MKTETGHISALEIGADMLDVINGAKLSNGPWFDALMIAAQVQADRRQAIMKVVSVELLAFELQD